MVLLPEPE
ncbi:hypothetical protein D039_0646A, partial [Vibrio parahaemolyticus EKP-028]